MLKCMVCGRQFRYVNNTHLRGHRLTIQQYKVMFRAEIFTQEFLQKRRQSCQGRVFKRTCPRCGSRFATGNPKTFYCGRCQPIVSIEKRRRYQAHYRRIRKRTEGRVPSRILGTFSERHLTIHKGRVLLAIMLEKGISPNNSFRAHNEEYYAQRERYVECMDCGTNMVIDIVGGEAHCSECGCKILVARENLYYSMEAEPVCAHCGLVYTIPQIPFFSVWGEAFLNSWCFIIIGGDCESSSSFYVRKGVEAGGSAAHSRPL